MRVDSVALPENYEEVKESELDFESPNKIDLERPERELNSSEILRYYRIIDRELDRQKRRGNLPENLYFHLIPIGGETPALLSPEDDFSVKTSDMDLYGRIKGGDIDRDTARKSLIFKPKGLKSDLLELRISDDEEENIFINRLEGSIASVELVDFEIGADILLDSSLPANSDESEEWLGRALEYEVENEVGQTIYDGESLKVQLPTPELYYLTKFQRRAQNIKPSNRTKRKDQIEMLNQATDSQYNQWKVFPSKDEEMEGSWDFQVSNKEELVEEFKESLSRSTKGRYSLEKRGEQNYAVINPKGMAASLKFLQPKNSGDYLLSVKYGKEASTEMQELATVERALINSLEDFEEASLTKNNYSIKDVYPSILGNI